MRIWRTGESVHIEYAGCHANGTVVMASPNGQSLMLSFEAILGGYVGMMPVLADDDGAFRGLMCGKPVTLSDIGAVH